MSKALAATAATVMRMPPLMPHYSPRLSANPCACSGRAPTSTLRIERTADFIDLPAAMDAAGNVTAWEADFFIPQAGPGLDVPLTAATLAGLP